MVFCCHCFALICKCFLILFDSFAGMPGRMSTQFFWLFAANLCKFYSINDCVVKRGGLLKRKRALPLAAREREGATDHGLFKTEGATNPWLFRTKNATDHGLFKTERLERATDHPKQKVQLTMGHPQVKKGNWPMGRSEQNHHGSFKTQNATQKLFKTGRTTDHGLRYSWHWATPMNTKTTTRAKPKHRPIARQSCKHDFALSTTNTTTTWYTDALASGQKHTAIHQYLRTGSRDNPPHIHESLRRCFSERRFSSDWNLTHAVHHNS